MPSSSVGNYSLQAKLVKGWNLAPFFNPPAVSWTDCGKLLKAAQTYSPFDGKYVKLRTRPISFLNKKDEKKFSVNYGTLFAPAGDGKTYSPVFGGMWLYSAGSCNASYSFDSKYLPGSGSRQEQPISGNSSILYIEDGNGVRIKEIRGVPGDYENWTSPSGDRIWVEIVGNDAEANGTTLRIMLNGVPVDSDGVPDGLTDLDLAGGVDPGAIGFGSMGVNGSGYKYVLRLYVMGGRYGGPLIHTGGKDTPWLASGWNFLTVLPWMTWRYLEDVKGDCEIQSLQMWNEMTQKWEKYDPADFFMGGGMEGEVLALKAKQKCHLGESGVGEPPNPPG